MADDKGDLFEIDQGKNPKTDEDYTSSDVASVLNQVNFHFWGEVVDWLRKHALSDTKMTAEQANSMMRDFGRLSELGIPFTNDPEEAELVAKEYRR